MIGALNVGRVGPLAGGSCHTKQLAHNFRGLSGGCQHVGPCRSQFSLLPFLGDHVAPFHWHPP